jgi:hypothetical protein
MSCRAALLCADVYVGTHARSGRHAVSPVPHIFIHCGLAANDVAAIRSCQQLLSACDALNAS